MDNFCRKFKIHLQITGKTAIINLAKQIIYVKMQVYFEKNTYFSFNCIKYEFDKMQIPVLCNYKFSTLILYIICLATVGICVFMRQFQLAHFYF